VGSSEYVRSQQHGNIDKSTILVNGRMDCRCERRLDIGRNDEEVMKGKVENDGSNKLERHGALE
jgi:hypothetical protein